MSDTATQPVVTFEVYMYDSGRWTLHARFRRDEREAALAEAKVVERNLNLASRVVRDTYRPTDNTSDETIIYISDKSLMANTSRKSGGNKGVEAQASEARAGKSAGGAVAIKGRGGDPGLSAAITTLSLVVIVSVIGAGFITAVMSLLLSRLDGIVKILTPDQLPLVDVVVFVLSFLVLSVPMANKKLHWFGESSPQPPRQVKAPPKKVVKAPPKKVVKPVEAVPEPEEENKEEEKPEEKEEEKPEEKKEEEAPSASAIEENSNTMLAFLKALLAEVTKLRPQLDAINRFGVNLMLVGGVESLGDKNNIPVDSRRELLRQAVEKMGTKPETAKTFADKYEDYVGEPRYLGMVQAGQAAMNAHLGGGKISVASTMEAWNKPQAAQAQPQIMTVMFTDMVGSTDLTQAIGDKAAQEIVHRHNTIVRQALRQYSGKEIKHTGDGIMASFASAANGVEAAVVIHRQIIATNRKGETELHVRIGVNAGEPIQEDDDLFGSTVQMAARVCAAAGRDEILCTNVVRELAGNKGINFESRGDQTLKGFKDKVSLFEVKWN